MVRKRLKNPSAAMVGVNASERPPIVDSPTRLKAGAFTSLTLFSELE